MAFKITYRKNNEQVDLEWIVPTGWGETAIRESFELQFPQAEILKLEAIL